MESFLQTMKNLNFLKVSTTSFLNRMIVRINFKWHKNKWPTLRTKPLIFCTSTTLFSQLSYFSQRALHLLRDITWLYHWQQRTREEKIMKIEQLHCRSPAVNHRPLNLHSNLNFSKSTLIFFRSIMWLYHWK